MDCVGGGLDRGWTLVGVIWLHPLHRKSYKFPQTDLKSHNLRMNIVKLHTVSDRKLDWGWEYRLKYSVEKRLYTVPV